MALISTFKHIVKPLSTRLRVDKEYDVTRRRMARNKSLKFLNQNTKFYFLFRQRKSFFLSFDTLTDK